MNALDWAGRPAYESPLKEKSVAVLMEALAEHLRRATAVPAAG